MMHKVTTSLMRTSNGLLGPITLLFSAPLHWYYSLLPFPILPYPLLPSSLSWPRALALLVLACPKREHLYARNFVCCYQCLKLPLFIFTRALLSPLWCHCCNGSKREGCGRGAGWGRGNLLLLTTKITPETIFLYIPQYNQPNTYVMKARAFTA